MDDEKQMDRVQKIPIAELVPFKDHPFKVVDDEKMEELGELSEAEREEEQNGKTGCSKGETG